MNNIHNQFGNYSAKKFGTSVGDTTPIKATNSAHQTDQLHYDNGVLTATSNSEKNQQAFPSGGEKQEPIGGDFSKVEIFMKKEGDHLIKSISVGEKNVQAQGDNRDDSRRAIINLSGFVKEIISYGQPYGWTDAYKRVIVSHIKVVMMDGSEKIIGEASKTAKELNTVTHGGFVEKLEIWRGHHIDQVIIHMRKRAKHATLSMPTGSQADGEEEIANHKVVDLDFLKELKHPAIPAGTSTQFGKTLQNQLLAEFQGVNSPSQYNSPYLTIEQEEELKLNLNLSVLWDLLNNETLESTYELNECQFIGNAATIIRRPDNLEKNDVSPFLAYEIVNDLLQKQPHISLGDFLQSINRNNLSLAGVSPHVGSKLTVDQQYQLALEQVGTRCKASETSPAGWEFLLYDDETHIPSLNGKQQTINREGVGGQSADSNVGYFDIVRNEEGQLALVDVSQEKQANPSDYSSRLVFWRADEKAFAITAYVPTNSTKIKNAEFERAFTETIGPQTRTAYADLGDIAFNESLAPVLEEVGDDEPVYILEASLSTSKASIPVPLEKFVSERPLEARTATTMFRHTITQMARERVSRKGSEIDELNKILGPQKIIKQLLEINETEIYDILGSVIIPAVADDGENAPNTWGELGTQVSKRLQDSKSKISSDTKTSLLNSIGNFAWRSQDFSSFKAFLTPKIEMIDLDGQKHCQVSGGLLAMTDDLVKKINDAANPSDIGTVQFKADTDLLLYPLTDGDVFRRKSIDLNPRNTIRILAGGAEKTLTLSTAGYDGEHGEAGARGADAPQEQAVGDQVPQPGGNGGKLVSHGKNGSHAGHLRIGAELDERRGTLIWNGQGGNGGNGQKGASGGNGQPGANGGEGKDAAAKSVGKFRYHYKATAGKSGKVGGAAGRTGEQAKAGYGGNAGTLYIAENAGLTTERIAELKIKATAGKNGILADRPKDEKAGVQGRTGNKGKDGNHDVKDPLLGDMKIDRNATYEKTEDLCPGKCGHALPQNWGVDLEKWRKESIKNSGRIFGGFIPDTKEGGGYGHNGFRGKKNNEVGKCPLDAVVWKPLLRQPPGRDQDQDNENENENNTDTQGDSDQTAEAATRNVVADVQATYIEKSAEQQSFVMLEAHKGLSTEQQIEQLQEEKNALLNIIKLGQQSKASTQSINRQTREQSQHNQVRSQVSIDTANEAIGRFSTDTSSEYFAYRTLSALSKLGAQASPEELSALFAQASLNFAAHGSRNVSTKFIAVAESAGLEKEQLADLRKQQASMREKAKNVSLAREKIFNIPTKDALPPKFHAPGKEIQLFKENRIELEKLNAPQSMISWGLNVVSNTVFGSRDGDQQVSNTLTQRGFETDSTKRVRSAFALLKAKNKIDAITYLEQSIHDCEQLPCSDARKNHLVDNIELFALCFSSFSYEDKPGDRLHDVPLGAIDHMLWADICAQRLDALDVKENIRDEAAVALAKLFTENRNHGEIVWNVIAQHGTENLSEKVNDIVQFLAIHPINRILKDEKLKGIFVDQKSDWKTEIKKALYPDEPKPLTLDELLTFTETSTDKSLLKNQISRIRENLKAPKTQLMTFSERHQAINEERIVDVATDLCRAMKNATRQEQIKKSGKGEGFYPYDIQLLALLEFMHAGNENKGLVAQIETGEGKSWVTRLVVGTLASRGQYVNVVTSKADLAQRDAKESKYFFNLLGLECDQVCEGDDSVITDNYKKNHILYGRAQDFESHRIETYKRDKNICKDRPSFTTKSKTVEDDQKSSCLFIDEIDSTILDDSAATLYMPDNVHDMRALEDTARLIYDVVKEVNALVYSFSPESCQRSLISSVDVFKGMPLKIADELMESYDPDEDNEYVIHIIQSGQNYYAGYYDADGNRLIDLGMIDLSDSSNGTKALLNELEESVEFGELSNHESYIADIVSRCGYSGKAKITAMKAYERLQPRLKELGLGSKIEKLANKKLSTWIDSAITALSLKEDEDYVVDKSSNDGDDEIKVINRGTGEIEDVQWTDLLHQFLEIEHCLKMSEPSTMSSFESNLSFVQSFGGRVYGVTGTLGDPASSDLLCDIAKGRRIVVPRRIPSQLQEMPPIVTNSVDDWSHQIAGSINSAKEANRPTLLVCETIAEAKALTAQLKASGISVNETYLNGDDMAERGHQLDAVNGGDVYVVTNIGGRGTDIQFNETLEGGLHVILTFVPDNERVEWQAKGRAGRNGASGTCQMIVRDGAEWPMSIQKYCRDIQEAVRVDRVRTDEMPKNAVMATVGDQYTEAMSKFNEVIEGAATSVVDS